MDKITVRTLARASGASVETIGSIDYLHFPSEAALLRYRHKNPYRNMYNVSIDGKFVLMVYYADLREAA